MTAIKVQPASNVTIVVDRGVQGPTGSQGATGDTGFTGAEGATGPSQWNNTAYTGATGPGYTGIGYTGDVMIFGNLYVEGGIDPTYLALEPQPSGPTGFTNPLWVDSVNGNALRSQNIYMDNPSGTGNTGAYISLIPDNTNQIILNDGATVNANSNIINYSSMTISDALNTLTIDKNNITHSGVIGPLTITATDAISLNAGLDINLTATTSLTGKINVNVTNGVVINQQGLIPPDTTITTLNGNTIEIFEDKNTTTGIVNQVLIDNTNVFIDNTDNTAQTQIYGRVSPNQLELYDHTSSGTNTSRLLISSEVFEYQRSGTKPAFYKFNYLTNEVFRMAINGIIMGSSGTGVKLNANNIQYPATFNNTSANISTTSNAVQTFNGSSLTATLFNVSATNVGTQFIITNTSASNLTVTTTGGTQLIYSIIGAASATSRTLATGHSNIFTAILTTSASTYGWSMV